MKKKIHKLTLKTNGNHKLIGIASHENDYRISWGINNALGIELKKVEDFTIVHPKHKIEINYPMFSFTDEANYLNYTLISNKSENGFLLPELKNIDFILKLSGETDSNIINHSLNLLKKSEIIITAFIIESLTAKMNNIFEH